MIGNIPDDKDDAAERMRRIAYASPTSTVRKGKKTRRRGGTRHHRVSGLVQRAR